MRADQLEQRFGNCERRLDRIEQILPTLATRDDLKVAVAPLATREELRVAVAPLATREELRAAVAPLATREELRAAVAPLATKEEMKEEIKLLATKEELRVALSESEQRMRVHFDVVAESLRHQIQLLAEAVAVFSERER